MKTRSDPEGAIINYGSRARVGLLLPSGNQAAEPQFNAMLPPGVSLHTTRLRLTGSSESELLAMADTVEQAAQLVAHAHPDIVLFHCTAVSTFSKDLEQSILARIRHASGLPTTATSEALVSALRFLQARRIVMLSPYVDAINVREAAFFEGAGFEVLVNKGKNCVDADAMMGVTPAEWQAFALEHQHPHADAYVMSCTTVRATDVAGELERQLDAPVITSNTAAVWHCLRQLGLPDAVPGFGALLARAA